MKDGARGASRAARPPYQTDRPGLRDASALLTLENVTQRFGELAAVNDLSFERRRGRGVRHRRAQRRRQDHRLQPHLGLPARLRATSRFDGKRIDGLPPHRVTQLGVARTFQIPQPFHSMTVVQNLRVGEHFGARAAEPRRSTALPWTDLSELISFVGLEGKEDKPVTTLKLYDKKLTVLASALATRPRLIMLDEALGGLSAVEAELSLSLAAEAQQGMGSHRAHDRAPHERAHAFVRPPAHPEQRRSARARRAHAPSLRTRRSSSAWSGASMLEVENISAFYGEYQAIHDISLQVAEGQLVSIFGPNGHGKSTLLKTICGLMKPASGIIRFEGREIQGLPSHKLVEMGVVLISEERHLFPGDDGHGEPAPGRLREDGPQEGERRTSSSSSTCSRSSSCCRQEGAPRP